MRIIKDIFIFILLGVLMFQGYKFATKDAQYEEEAQYETDPQADAKLSRSAKADDSDLARYAILHGANPNVIVRSESGTTALHIFAFRNNVEIVKLLLKYGAKPNVRNHSGETPLHVSARAGRYAIAKLLVDNGARVNMKTVQEVRTCRGESYPSGSTPLGYAKISGNKYMRQMLQEYGSSE